MASFGYTEIITSSIFLLFLYTFLNTKRGHPTNWPFLGMIPTLALNSHRFHNKVTNILEATGGTFLLKGFWFTNTDKLFTCDPDNIHYVHNEKFDNFEKGDRNKKIFDILGDTLFNADHDDWRKDGKMFRAFVNDRRFIHAAIDIVHEKLEECRMPVLEHVIAQGGVVDLQNLFTRLMLDATYILTTGYNPNSLSIGFPDCPLPKANEDINDRIIRRHFIPNFIWKVERWLNIAGEFITLLV